MIQTPHTNPSTGLALLPLLGEAAAGPGRFDLSSLNWFRSGILVVLGATLLLLAIRRLRSYRLKERYALLFLFLALPFLLLAVWPGVLDYLAELLHISYTSVMLLCVSTFLILTVFELLTIVSQQDRKISTLAQMVGILMEKQKQQESQETATPPATAVGTPPPPAPKPEVTLHPVTPRRLRDAVRSEK